VDIKVEFPGKPDLIYFIEMGLLRVNLDSKENLMKLKLMATVVAVLLLCSESSVFSQSPAPQKQQTENKEDAEGGMKQGTKDVGKATVDGGKALGKGSVDFGKKTVKGDLGGAGKSMGKGAGEFGKDVGTGTGKGAKKIGKGLGRATKKATRKVTAHGDEQKPGTAPAK
jgi:hypothetical protein